METTEKKTSVPATVEVTPDTPEVSTARQNPYEGLGTSPVSKDVQAILDRPPEDLEVQIAEDGKVYLPHEVYRQRLFEAFGSMAWGLEPVRSIQQGNKVIYQGRLIINGRVVAEDVGESEYFPSNKGASWADAFKGAKSECLKACCKDLIGGFTCLWNKQWRDKWAATYAVKVWRKPKPGRDQKPCFRRKDSPRFYDETGFCKDQPEGGGSGSGPGGNQAMREKLGMKPREVDPVAIEKRRQEWEELLSNPMELDLESLQTLIVLCDDLEQMEDQRLLDHLKTVAKGDEKALKEMYGAHRQKLRERAGDPD